MRYHSNTDAENTTTAAACTPGAPDRDRFEEGALIDVLHHTVLSPNAVWVRRPTNSRKRATPMRSPDGMEVAAGVGGDDGGENVTPSKRGGGRVNGPGGGKNDEEGGTKTPGEGGKKVDAGQATPAGKASKGRRSARGGKKGAAPAPSRSDVAPPSSSGRTRRSSLRGKDKEGAGAAVVEVPDADAGGATNTHTKTNMTGRPRRKSTKLQSDEFVMAEDDEESPLKSEAGRPSDDDEFVPAGVNKAKAEARKRDGAGGVGGEAGARSGAAHHAALVAAAVGMTAAPHSAQPANPANPATRPTPVSKSKKKSKSKGSAKDARGHGAAARDNLAQQQQQQQQQVGAENPSSLNQAIKTPSLNLFQHFQEMKSPTGSDLAGDIQKALEENIQAEADLKDISDLMAEISRLNENTLAGEGMLESKSKIIDELRMQNVTLKELFAGLGLSRKNLADFSMSDDTRRQTMLDFGRRLVSKLRHGKETETETVKEKEDGQKKDKKSVETGGTAGADAAKGTDAPVEAAEEARKADEHGMVNNNSNNEEKDHGRDTVKTQDAMKRQKSSTFELEERFHPIAAQVAGAGLQAAKGDPARAVMYLINMGLKARQNDGFQEDPPGGIGGGVGLLASGAVAGAVGTADGTEAAHAR